MKKIISMTLVCVLLLGCVFAFASCSNISESYAKKINKAAEADKHYTYEDVKKDLGEDVVDVTVSLLGSTNGILVAVKGVSSLDELEDKLDDGKTVKGIIVTIVNNKATKAVYKEITEDDL